MYLGIRKVCILDPTRTRSDNKQLHCLDTFYFQMARRQGLDEGHLFDWRFQTTLRARSDNKQLHGASTHFSLRKQERKDWMKGTCFIACSRPPSVPGQIINNCIRPGHILVSGGKKTKTGWRAPVSLQVPDYPRARSDNKQLHGQTYFQTARRQGLHEGHLFHCRF